MKLYVKKVKTSKGTNENLWIDFTHEGKRYRKSLGLKNTPTNRKIANTRIIPEIQLKIVTGEFFKNETKIPTVDEYMKVSFDLQSGNRGKACQKDYILKYNKHIKSVFGNKKLNAITTNSITSWQNKLLKEKGLKPKTIKQIRGLLYTMFEDALKESSPIIQKNPVIGVGKLKEEVIITEDNINSLVDNSVNPFTIEEVKLILNNAPNEQMKNLFALLFFTGCRGGEAIALTWEKIDFKNKTIKIDRKLRQGEFGFPKYKSIRTIPILDVLLPYLQSQFNLTGDKKSFVFLNPYGRHLWDTSKFRDTHWKKTLKKANIVYRSPHTTRHTFISTLISNGEDINYVSKVAGHDSVKTTLEVYSHFIPNNNENFGLIFNKNFAT